MNGVERRAFGKVAELRRGTWKGRRRLVNWHVFQPSDFEYDFESDKLADHSVAFEEAVECFFSEYEIRRNRRFADRYQLIGTSRGGRRLKIIFQLRPDDIVRIITGWPI